MKLLLALAAVTMCLLVSACGGGGNSHPGFLDHTKLERDLTQQMQKRLDTSAKDSGYAKGTAVDEMLCVQGSGPNDHVFQCVSGNHSESIEADVSPNGDSFVTK